MTKEEREESIDLIDNLIGMIEDNHNSDYDKALKMAIKSLEQEPCEDAISRQEAIKSIGNYFLRVETNGTIEIHQKLFNEFLKAINETQKKILLDLPSVRPKAKVGKWIESHVPESVLVECSECGFSCGAPSFNYCPMCSAKMEGVQE